MSKPSAPENWYFHQLAAYLRDNWVRCPIYSNLRATERSHPRGVGFWETGASMKAHHFFAIGLSRQAHLEYDPDHDNFERRHGITHAELVNKQWEALGVTHGEWMLVGMNPKREAWLKRVLERLQISP